MIRPLFQRPRRLLALAAGLVMSWGTVSATPANRAALDRHYDRFLARPLAACITCHRPATTATPESLDEIPHNPFGARLRELGRDRTPTGEKPDLSTRLRRVAAEDSDGDGVPNETELLLGHNPGDPRDTPNAAELKGSASRKAEFDRFLASYRWQPFAPVVRPPVPAIASTDAGVILNPVDQFIAAGWKERGLKPRPEATKEVLLRRVTVDLIGLNPTPEELHAFLADTRPDAYERVVDRLLNDPRHGERWARHWMDVWRYSDWAGWNDGGQVRDSQRHIWRWRDWIVESLNADRPYDRMVQEMFAADELAPNDPDALRATGFLVRNYKMLSREQWLEDTVKHTGLAFLGITLGCAKCHDHMTDPISQREYYAFRAIFEPHQVRTDRIPGQLDITKDGLVRAYDVGTNAPTYFLVRGDERHPRTNDVLAPGVPSALGGRLDVQLVLLPDAASRPNHRDFVKRDLVAAAETTLRDALQTRDRIRADASASPGAREEAQWKWLLADARLAALKSVLAVEGGSAPDATNAVRYQRAVAVFDAELERSRAYAALAAAKTNALADARKKLEAADAAVAKAVETAGKPLDGRYTPRKEELFPTFSTGRRLALARWLTDPQNPLLARVAVNQVWLRHFGRGLVATPSDFGRNGRAPTHPELLDWLAAEFMHPTAGNASPWSFKALHRLLVTSAAYRRAATPDASNLAVDPDNLTLWRMNSRRLEAEAVRDMLLQAANSLDQTRGGADLDHNLALTSPRRSLYLRHAAEKQSEFLQIFDGPSVTECYLRRPSVIPQQALALGNSELAVRLANQLGESLARECPGDPSGIVDRAFERILARRPTAVERRACLERFTPAAVSESLATAALKHEAGQLVLVLFNHNEFVTVR